MDETNLNNSQEQSQSDNVNLKQELENDIQTGSGDEIMSTLDLQDMEDDQFENFLQTKRKELSDKGYFPLPRGIHQEGAVRMYRDVLHAGERVMKILESGYSPQWSNGPPPNTKLENNKSAAQNMSFVREQVQQWCDLGFVKQVEEEPWVISPLSVDTKVDISTGKR